MISLNQLEIFAAVVECGGFSGAAKRLFMSQSSVSSHVRALDLSWVTSDSFRKLQGVELQ